MSRYNESYISNIRKSMQTSAASGSVTDQYIAQIRNSMQEDAAQSVPEAPKYEPTPQYSAPQVNSFEAAKKAETQAAQAFTDFDWRSANPNNASAVMANYHSLLNEKNRTHEEVQKLKDPTRTGMAGDYFTQQGVKTGISKLVQGSAAQALTGIRDTLLASAAIAPIGANQKEWRSHISDIAPVEEKAQNFILNEAAKNEAANAAVAEEYADFDEWYDTGIKLASSGVGSMAPNMVASSINPMLGYAAIAGQGYGGGYTEALQKGATTDQAQVAGALSGAVSLGTEKLFDGFGGLKMPGGGVLDDVGKGIASKLPQNKVVQGIASGVGKSLGEGSEEVLESVGNDIAAKIAYNDDTGIERFKKGEMTWGDIGADLGTDFLGGALAAGVSNASVGAVNVARNKAASLRSSKQATQSAPTAEAEQDVNTPLLPQKGDSENLSAVKDFVVKGTMPIEAKRNMVNGYQESGEQMPAASYEMAMQNAYAAGKKGANLESAKAQFVQVVGAQAAQAYTPTFEKLYYNGVNEAANMLQASPAYQSTQESAQAAPQMVQAQQEGNSIAPMQPAQNSQQAAMSMALDAAQEVSPAHEQQAVVPQMPQPAMDAASKLPASENTVPQQAVSGNSVQENTPAASSQQVKPEAVELDAPTQETLTRFAEESNYAEPVKAALLQSYQPNTDPNVHAKAFTDAYHAGQTGMLTLEDAKDGTRSTVSLLGDSNPAYAQAYALGRAEAAQVQAQEISARSTKGVQTDTPQVNVEDGVQLPAQFYQAVSQKLGINIDAVRSLGEDVNGMWEKAIAKITLSNESENQYQTLVHELMEFMQDYDPKATAELRHALLAFAAKNEGMHNTQRYIAQYQRAYDGASSAEVSQEFANDLMSGIMSTEENQAKFLEFVAEDGNYTSPQKKTIFQTVRDLFEKLLNTLKDMTMNATHGAVLGESLAEKNNAEAQQLAAQFLQNLRVIAEDYNISLQDGTKKAAAPDVDAADGKRYSKIGVDPDTNKSIYESNFPWGIGKDVKGERIIELCQKFWSKTPIPLSFTDSLTGEKKETVANYDPWLPEDTTQASDLGKLSAGNKKGNNSEQRVTLSLADDYPDILREATYQYSKEETGKESDTHQGVSEWHYFVDHILYMEQGKRELAPYVINIAVKEKEDGLFVYTYSAESLKKFEQKKARSSQTIDAARNQDAESTEVNTNLYTNNMPQTDENVNAFDEKNDTASEIRYSIGVTDNIDKTAKQLAYENKKLQERVDLLEQEFKLTDGHKMDRVEVHRLAGKLLTEWESQYDPAQFEAQLHNLFEYIANAKELSWGDVMDTVSILAKSALEQSAHREPSLRKSDARYEELYQTLSAVTVSETEYSSLVAQYGKAAFGKIAGIRVVKDSGAHTGLDVKLATLAEEYPEFFTPDLSSNDIFERMVEVRKSLSSEVVGPAFQDIDDAAYDMAEELFEAYLATPEKRTFADKQAEKAAALREEYSAKRTAALAKQREHYKKKLADLKASYESKLDELKQSDDKRTYERVLRALERPDGSVLERQAQYRGYIAELGKVNSGTKRKTSKIFSNTYAATQLWAQVDKLNVGIANRDNFQYDVISEKESQDAAKARLEHDYEGEKFNLMKNGAYTGEDVDTMMGLISGELKQGKVGEALKLARSLQRSATEAGRQTQALAKYTRTAVGHVCKASDTLTKEGKAWADRNQKDAGAVRDISAELEVFIKKANEKELTYERIVEEIKKAVFESDLSGRWQGDLTDKAVDKLAKLIDKNTTAKQLDDLFTNYFSCGLFDFGDDTINTVMELFEQAEELNPNSKAYAQKMDEAYELLAKDMNHKVSAGDKFRSWRYMSMLSSLRTSIKNIGGNIMMGNLVQTKDAVKVLVEKSAGNLVQQRLGVTKKDRAQGYTKTAAVLMPTKKDNTDLGVMYTDFDNSRYAQGTKVNRYNIESGIMGKTPVFNTKAIEGFRNAVNFAMEAEDIKGASGMIAAVRAMTGDSTFAKGMRKKADVIEAFLDQKSAEGLVFWGGVQNNYARAATQYLKANNIRASAAIALEAEVAKRKAQDEEYQPNDQQQETLDMLEAARNYAIKEAMRATFHDVNVITKTFTNIQEVSGVVGDAVLPFAQTPANILARGIDYSPLGFVRAVVDAKSGKGAEQVIDDISCALTGTGLIAFGILMGSLGFVNGGLSDDDKKRQIQQLQGMQAYSLNTPWGTYTLDWASPANLPFFIGVDLADMKIFGGDGDVNPLDALLGVADPMLEMTMLAGLSDLLNTLKYANEDERGADVVSNLVGNIFGQAVPTYAKQVARSFRDNRASTYTGSSQGSMNAAKRAVNSATAGLLNEDYVDLWGRTQKNTGGNLLGRLLYNTTSPGYWSSTNVTDFDRALNELYDSTQDSAVYPNNPSKKITLDGEARNLTPEEYEIYTKHRGQIARSLAKTFIASADYNKLDDAVKVEILSDLYSLANKVGLKQVDSSYEITNDLKLYSAYVHGGFDMAVDYELLQERSESSGAIQVNLAELSRMDWLSDADRAYLFTLKSEKASQVYNEKGQAGAQAWYKYQLMVDIDKSGSVTQQEAISVLNRMNITRDQKIYYFGATNSSWKDKANEKF